MKPLTLGAGQFHFISAVHIWFISYTPLSITWTIVRSLQRTKVLKDWSNNLYCIVNARSYNFSAITGAKVMTAFQPCLFCFSNFAFSRLGNRVEISPSYEPKTKFVPVTVLGSYEEANNLICKQLDVRWNQKISFTVRWLRLNRSCICVQHNRHSRNIYSIHGFQNFTVILKQNRLTVRRGITVILEQFMQWEIFSAIFYHTSM